MSFKSVSTVLSYVAFVIFSSISLSYDNSILFAPNFQLSKIDKALPDLVGKSGNQLCGPIAVTHAMEFLKNRRQPAFTQLPSIPDVDGDGRSNSYEDRVRYFFKACGTDKNSGTKFRSMLACMRNYIGSGPYKPWAYMIGPQSIEAPNGYSLDSVRHVLRLEDIQSYVKEKSAVIMAVGWYQFNPSTNKYQRTGGHFVNLYGFGTNSGWNENQLDVFAVNPSRDYSSREPSDMYDTVKLSTIQVLSSAPADVRFQVSGPGFDLKTYKAFVEDIFVAFPL